MDKQAETTTPKKANSGENSVSNAGAHTAQPAGARVGVQAARYRTAAVGVDFKALAVSVWRSGLWIALIAYGFMLSETLQILSSGAWQTEKDGHGPYILIITAAFFAIRFKDIRALPNNPSPIAGWLLVVLGLFCFLVGRSQSQVFFAMGAQVPILAGFLLIYKGWRSIGLMWFPLLFMGFAVPLPGWFLDSTTQWAKLYISDLVTYGLHALDYPVAHDGVVIWVGTVRLLVEDACSGLNALYSLMAVGFLYVYITRGESWVRSLLLIGWILPAAFLSNLVRVALLVVITHHLGVEAGQGFLHDSAGFMMFLFALVSFFAFDTLITRLMVLVRRKRSVGAKGATATDVAQAPQIHEAAEAEAEGAPLAAKTGWPVSVRMVVIAGLFVMAVPVGNWMVPKATTPYVDANFSLADQIPLRFGDWEVIASDGFVLPTGRTFSRASIYDQQLSRAYRNKNGDTIMLLIAYGHNQSDALQLHRPEICYAAVGFKLLREEGTLLDVPTGALLQGGPRTFDDDNDDADSTALSEAELAPSGQRFPATYLETRRVERFEPVTYWTRVGDDIPSDVVALQLQKLWTGLRGRVPDGALIRVSSIANGAESHAALHKQFINQFLVALPESIKPMILGDLAKQPE